MTSDAIREAVAEGEAWAAERGLPASDPRASDAVVSALEAAGFVVVRRDEMAKSKQTLEQMIEGVKRSGQHVRTIREAMRKYGSVVVDEGTRAPDPGATALRDGEL
jgi:hypothetical protein